MTFPRFDIVAAAVADPTRAQLLCHLMDGRAFTNKELSSALNVTPQTISGHIARLTDLDLVHAQKSGRSVYHRLANEGVATLLEQMAHLAPNADLYQRNRRRAGPTGFARCCYNHLAGELGVTLTQTMIANGDLVHHGPTLNLTTAGQARLAKIGLAPTDLTLRPCLDWTERRHHMAGPLATALLTWFLEAHWLNRSDTPRALDLTPKGRQGFAKVFDLHL